MPLWFGHAKRIEAVENAVKTLDTDIRNVDTGMKQGFSDIASKIEELGQDFEPNPNSQGQNIARGPEVTEEPVNFYEGRLAAINAALAKTTDPDKIAELMEAKKLLRRDAVADRQSRRRRLGIYEARPRQPLEPEIVEEGAPPTPQEVEEIAQRVGVTKAGGLDPIKFATGIKGLVDKNPGLAKTLFKAFGGDKLLADAGITGGLEAGLGLLDEIIKQGKADELAATVGNGLGALVKEKVGPWVMSKATPTAAQAPLVPAGPQQQFTNPQGLTCTFGPDGKAYAYDPATKGFTTRLWMRDGIGWIDPRLRYPMPTGPGLV
jgi:hypothetical protein